MTPWEKEWEDEGWEEEEEESPFWGKAGAGVLPVAESTGQFLVQLRSGRVFEPYTWGVGALNELFRKIQELARSCFSGPISFLYNCARHQAIANYHESGEFVRCISQTISAPCHILSAFNSTCLFHAAPVPHPDAEHRHGLPLCISRS